MTEQIEIYYLKNHCQISVSNNDIGIELTIVKLMIEKLGGQNHLKGGLDEGSNFIIELLQ